MAEILKYTCDVSDINNRYQKIHNDIFSLSVRKLAIEMFTAQRVSLKKHEEQLKMLLGELMKIQAALNTLPQSELNILRGKHILLALSDYVTALVKSIYYLQKICNEKNTLLDSDNNLVKYKTIYDDAIQQHKNLGNKLNDLLSIF